jgi:hypothetical protein
MLQFLTALTASLNRHNEIRPVGNEKKNLKVDWMRFLFMESVSSKTSQLSRRRQPLLYPKVHSASLGITLTKMTPDAARQLFSADSVQQRRPSLKFLIQIRKCYLLYIYPKLIRHLQQGINLQLVRAAVRWPMLERFLPSIRNRAAWDALSDRVRIESGEGLSTSPLDLLVRQLRAYHEEMPRLTVIHSAAVL